jgi:hypothetical protein
MALLRKKPKNEGKPTKTSAATDDDKSVLLDASLTLSQTQILAQNQDEASLDGQVMGLVAFNGALVAADIAAKEVIGTYWRVPLLGIGLATLLCLFLGFGMRGDLGLKAATFYEHYGGQLAIPGREQLLADLDAAFDRNAARIRAKYIGVRCAEGLLLLGLILAALLIVSAAPTRIKTCETVSHVRQSAKRPSGSHSRQASRMSGPAAFSDNCGHFRAHLRYPTFAWPPVH